MERHQVPSLGGNALVGEVLAQLGENDARLHAQAEGAVGAAAQAEIAVHARRVEHVTAMGHGAGGKARARRLDGNGRALFIELGEDRADLILARGKRDRLSRAGAARFVARVLLVLRAERCDGCHICASFSLVNYSASRRYYAQRHVWAMTAMPTGTEPTPHFEKSADGADGRQTACGAFALWRGHGGRTARKLIFTMRAASARPASGGTARCGKGSPSWERRFTC